MFTTGAGRWLLRVLAAHQPRQYISGALAGEGDLTKEQLDRRVDEVFADPVKRDFVLALGPTTDQDKTRRTGYHNMDQFARITSLELEKITAPTLVVQGSADSDVAPAYSAFAAASIPGAELLTLDTGTTWPCSPIRRQPRPRRASSSSCGAASGPRTRPGARR